MNAKGVLPKVSRPADAKWRPKKYEQNTKPSRTIPNQSLTITEMVERYRKGLPIHANAKAPIYGGEAELRDLDTMDLVDRQAYIDSVADHLVEVRARLEENAKTEAQKAHLAEVDKQVRERIASMYPDKPGSTDEKPL